MGKSTRGVNRARRKVYQGGIGWEGECIRGEQVGKENLSDGKRLGRRVYQGGTVWEGECIRGGIGWEGECNKGKQVEKEFIWSEIGWEGE